MLKNAILLDDHRIILEGLENLLSTKGQYTVVLSTNDPAKVTDFLSGENPVVPADTFAIVDLQLKDTFSFPIITQLKERGIKVIVYSMYENIFYIKQAVDAGAFAYAFKSDPPEKLLSIISETDKGNRTMPEQVVSDYVTFTMSFSSFTSKEMLIANYVLSGSTNDEIAKKLSITVRTVENYLSNMYDKSFCENRTDFISKFGR